MGGFNAKRRLCCYLVLIYEGGDLLLISSSNKTINTYPLLNLLREGENNADTAQEVNMLAKLEELEQRVKALETGNTEPGEAYPDYVVGKWYYNGDKITFEGGKYNCIAPDGAVCTWSPKEYPAYWELVI